MKKIVLNTIFTAGVLCMTVRGADYTGSAPVATITSFSNIFANGTAPFNASLSCYSCIRNNFIYCVKGLDHVIVPSGKADPSGICCSSYSACPQVNDPTYTCSSEYTDPFLSIRMCPYRVDACGASDSTVLSKTGTKASMTVNTLPGQVCVYNLRASCGAPAISVSATNTSAFEAFVLDYDDYDVETEYPLYASGKGASQVLIPDRAADMTPDELAADYYSPFYFDATLSDGTYLYSSNENGYLEVDYAMNSTYYSAYMSENETFFSNKYLNPLYGFNYAVLPGDSSASYYRVAWKSASKTTYPVANATQTYFPDESYIVTDNQGNTYYFSYDNLDPNFADFWYDPSDYNATWFATANPYNLVQTITSDSHCTYYTSSYTDGSAADFEAQVCKNGSYLFFPSVWTNFSSYYEEAYYLYTEYFANGSQMTYFNGSSQELYYETASGDSITQWWDANCSYQLSNDFWYLSAQCANHSTIFYPDSDMYYDYFDVAYYGKVVQDYILYANGSYSTLYTNGTIKYHALQTVTNITAGATHAWVNADGSLNAYWSPAYWKDLKVDSGLGYYWSGSAWVLSNYSLFTQFQHQIPVDPPVVVPPMNSSYKYLNTSGPMVVQYSFTAKGWHQYKNPVQSNSTQVYLNQPFDSICSGRN